MRIAVVGGGAVGSQTARHLARAGEDVTVFDRFAVPNEWGAHAGESRLLRSIPFLETAPGDRALLEAATDAWAMLERESGERLVDACGSLIIGAPGTPAMTRAARIARERPGATFFTRARLVRTHPAFTVEEDAVAVLDPEGGLVDPRRAVAAALMLARRDGARIEADSPVVAVEPERRGVRVRTDAGSDVFDRVVIATGSFSPGLLPDIPVRARRLLLGWYRPRLGAEQFLAGLPTFAWSGGDTFLYGGPSFDGATVKVGTGHDWGVVADPMAGREVSAEDIEALAETVAERLPWLDRAEGARYQMHIDGWSSDGHGVLGPLPADPRIVAAVGWSGHGFKLAPVLGEIAAELARDGEPSFDVSHLDPARFGRGAAVTSARA